MKTKHVAPLVLGILCVSFLGCGGVTRYPISGRVLSKGQPVADVKIVFHSSSGAIAGFAEPDAAGEFSESNGGLPEGRYDIAVIPMDVLRSDVTTETKPAWKSSIVPTKYHSSYTSGLYADVGPSGPGRLELALD
jgi:hypothetical protein